LIFPDITPNVFHIDLTSHSNLSINREGSKLKMVDLDALPTYKRVVAWFPDPAEDTGSYFHRLHRLNQGLDTSHWRVYEHKEKPNRVHLVLSIDTSFIMVLKTMEWRPFSGVGKAVFSLLGVKAERKK
jgi:hypothetical protein